MQDARDMERLGKDTHLAAHEDSAGLPSIRLNNIVRLVQQALSIRLKTGVAFTARYGHVDHAGKLRRRFVVIASEWFFEPVSSRFLEASRRFESCFEIPYLLPRHADRHVRCPV